MHLLAGKSRLQTGLIDARTVREDILETVHTSRLGHRPHMRQDRIFGVLHKAGTGSSEIAVVLRIEVDLRVSGLTKEACKNWLLPILFDSVRR